MEITGWIALGVLLIGFLVGLSWLIGRGLWRVVEPGDEDPGGAVSPPRITFNSGPTLVDVMRSADQLKQAKKNRNKPRS